MFRIFIGWDSQFPEPADVLRYSLAKHASIPLEIRYLKLDELGLERQHDPLASSEFTYSGFLVPHLCDFHGKALFLESDMLCLADVKELDELEMGPYSLRVVQYPRKGWSSMMLMDCSKLRLWTKDVVERQTGDYLHGFQDIPDQQIGALPNYWNTFDWMDETTKLIHYANGGPWLEQRRDHPQAAIWFRCRDEMRAAAKARFRGPHFVPAHVLAANLGPVGESTLQD